MAELKDELEELETVEEVESEEVAKEVTGETEVNSDDKLDTLINLITGLSEKIDTMIVQPEVEEEPTEEEQVEEQEETEMSVDEIDELLQGRSEERRVGKESRAWGA